MRYGPHHTIRIQSGGILEHLRQEQGDTDAVWVNSLHHQAIDCLAEDLRVEAVAEDGIIEAVSLARGRGFCLAVQWHPEHKAVRKQPLNQAIFAAFGEAVREQAAQRKQEVKT